MHTTACTGEDGATGNSGVLERSIDSPVCNEPKGAESKSKMKGLTDRERGLRRLER